MICYWEMVDTVIEGEKSTFIIAYPYAHKINASKTLVIQQTGVANWSNL